MMKLQWKQVSNALQRDAPNILDLIDLILTIPAISTECERGFSDMKRIKSIQRNCLDENSLSNLLMIKPQGPTIEKFNPDPAIQLWLNKGQKSRRINFMENKPKKERNTPRMLTESESLQIEERKHIENPDNSQPSTSATQEIEGSNNEEEPLPDVEVDDAVQVGANEVFMPPMEDDDFEEEIADIDYESDYETDTDEKFVHNYLKANELI